MPSYLAPGIYVEEIPSGPRPVEAVGTSVAGFVGLAPDASAALNEARWCDNWSQFVRVYAKPGNTSTPLSHAVFGFFENGGTRCCVVNVGAAGNLLGDGRTRQGLDLLETFDDIAIVAAPGYADASAYDALLSHCEKLRDRVAILDAPETVESIDALTKVAVATASPKSRREGDAPAAQPSAGHRPRQSDGGYGAFYFPHITVRDPFAPTQFVDVAPSGHIAGVYARSDATRGVHKAPANEVIRGAINVTWRVSHQEQEKLNPEGVNCIRFFDREGIRIYGARTVAVSSSEWRYLSVRRLFNMIEESIARSTRWVVFEPNDRPLWKAITRDVSAFLTTIWRQGALKGRTPDEAFFVRCNDETNPPEEIDAGRVTILIGIAPVKPAEFVIFRIGQTAEGTQVDAQS
ncbi:MAG: phage tail sheath family protein [Verrucomicrobium sp.]|nr:phage tail sheath C-terminal domain-containing protein [Verrucomicrobium sp.]